MDVILLRYGCYTKGMDVIPKVWMLYLRYGCYTLKVWMLYQRYGCYTTNQDIYCNIACGIVKQRHKWLLPIQLN